MKPTLGNLGKPGEAVRASAKAVLLLATLGINGCLMMVDGSTEPVALGSSPSGATAVVDGQEHTTPSTVLLARNTNHTIIFKKDGFEDASASIASAANPWLFGDFLLWGPLAFLDFANGSAYKLSEESVQVTLAQKQTILPASISNPAPPESSVKPASFAPAAMPAASMSAPVAARGSQPAAPIESAR